jgi:uncharacterized membrane protein
MSIKPKRHLAKAFTWRIIASLTTFAIGWAVTGDMHFGAAIGGFDVVIKIALYYFHERIWYHSRYGVVNEVEDKTKVKTKVEDKVEVEDKKEQKIRKAS